MKPSTFKISISVESPDKKNAENYRNCNVAEKCIIPNNQRYRSQILITEIEDLIENCVKICATNFYTFQEIGRKRAPRSVRVSTSY